MTDLVKFPNAVAAKWSSGFTTIAANRGVFLEGSDWGSWEGRLAVATLKAVSLRIFEFTDSGEFVSQVVVPELSETYGRLRTPIMGPDGALYVTTSNSPSHDNGGSDQILRVVPSRPPVFPSPTETRQVSERTPIGSNVATISATDPEGRPLRYKLDGPDAASFSLSSDSEGRLLTNEAIDYERQNTYELVLIALDDYDLSDTVTLTINITDVNDPPVITGDDSPTFSENANINNRLARYTATDPERDSVEWSVDGTDKDAFTIDTRGDLKFSSQPDHETKDEYGITIVATDDGDPQEKGEFPVTVSVEDFDEPPAITGGDALRFPENTATTTTLQTHTATDPEGVTTTFTWSLSGADRGDFEISNTGELTFKNAPDYERPADSGSNNVYNVQIRAFDGRLTGMLDLTVTVSGVNEGAPSTPTGRAAITVAENTTGNLARYGSTDPDRGDTVSVGRVGHRCRRLPHRLLRRLGFRRRPRL